MTHSIYMNSPYTFHGL